MFRYEYDASDFDGLVHGFEVQWGRGPIDFAQLEACYAWCVATFGRPDITRWSCSLSSLPSPRPRSYWLRHERDALQFRLRWC